MKAFSALAASILLAADVSAQTWCAKPRRNEPLLQEARALATSKGPEEVRSRRALGIESVPRDSVRVVDDEHICRDAAQAYWSHLRVFVPDLFGNAADTTVLVVRIGDAYLVDDKRNRKEFWEVMAFNRAWRRVYGYGGGS